MILLCKNVYPDDHEAMVKIANFIKTLKFDHAEECARTMLDHVKCLRKKYGARNENPKNASLKYPQIDTIGQFMMLDGDMVKVVAQSKGWVYAMPFDPNEKDDPDAHLERPNPNIFPIPIAYQRWARAYALTQVQEDDDCEACKL